MRWSLVLLALTGCHLVFELEPRVGDAAMSDDARTSYAETVRADSPVAYWRLGSASTDSAVDETDHGNTGTFEGGVMPGASGALARDTDPATDFDGDDDTITMGDRLSFEGNAPFTIEAWVRPAGHANYAGIVSKTDETDGGDTKSGYLLFDEATRFGCERSDGQTLQHVETGDLALDRWTHVAATFDGTTLSLYVDAVRQDSSTTAVSIPATSKSFAIGARNGGTWLFFTGSIDEVAIYDRALEKSQLERHRQIALGQ